MKRRCFQVLLVLTGTWETWLESGPGGLWCGHWSFDGISNAPRIQRGDSRRNGIESYLCSSPKELAVYRIPAWMKRRGCLALPLNLNNAYAEKVFVSLIFGIQTAASLVLLESSLLSNLRCSARPYNATIMGKARILMLPIYFGLCSS
ncbi:hypothetical protein F5880DRAFT_1090315 [Lentinula raphanica]|nr:hypothetical protein F5880DRAFT_1090315 [Lentinula raphanica]